MNADGKTYTYRGLGNRFKVCHVDECGRPASWEADDGKHLCDTHMMVEYPAKKKKRKWKFPKLLYWVVTGRSYDGKGNKQ